MDTVRRRASHPEASGNALLLYILNPFFYPFYVIIERRGVFRQGIFSSLPHFAPILLICNKIAKIFFQSFLRRDLDGIISL